MCKRITVITVCYNAENTIERTILSVLGQNYANLEYIVIDGDSKDRTKDKLYHYRHKIKSIISEPDNGIYDAMNKGVGLATGEWLIFMNSGDTFCEKDILTKMSNYLNDEICILRGNIVRVYNHVNVKSSGIVVQTPGIIDMSQNTFHHQACLIKKVLFEKYGHYDNEFKLCADWKFFFDCIVLHHEKSYYVDINVAYFPMDGISSEKTKDYLLEQKKYLRQLYGEELSSVFEEVAFYRRFYLCRIAYSLKKELTEKLSPNLFSNILNFKRICYSVFGLKVN